MGGGGYVENMNICPVLYDYEVCLDLLFIIIFLVGVNFKLLPYF